MTLKNFNQNDLVGLDTLKFEIEFVFCDKPKAIIDVYNNIIRSLTGCNDIATAQKNLDFGIKILNLYADLRYLIAHIQAGTDFINIRKEIFTDDFLDRMEFK